MGVTHTLRDHCQPCCSTATFQVGADLFLDTKQAQTGSAADLRKAASGMVVFSAFGRFTAIQCSYAVLVNASFPSP